MNFRGGGVGEILGKLIIFCLFYMPLTTMAVSIDLESKLSMYGTAELLLPCRFETVSTQCKLDTGVLFSRLHGEEVSEGLELINVVETVSVSGETMECPFYKLNQASIGNGEQELLSNTLGIVHCKEITNRPSLAGLDFVWKKVFSVDFKNLKLNLELPPLSALEAQPLAREKVVDSIILPFEAGRARVPVVGFYDTGATMTVVSKEYVKNHPDDFTHISSVNIGKDTFGNELTNDLMIMSRAEFQGHKLVAEYVMAIDFTEIKKNYGDDVEFIVGMNWIKNLKWTFDLKQSLFKVEE